MRAAVRAPAGSRHETVIWAVWPDSIVAIFPSRSSSESGSDSGPRVGGYRECR